LPGVNPFAPANKPGWRRFREVAVQFLQGGQRGAYGGSILLSHAYDDAALRNAYGARYGTEILKEGATVLFWKDSMRLTNYLDQRKIDPLSLAARVPSLRFVLPVRSPLDCVASNLRTHHYNLLNAQERSLQAGTRAILLMIRRFSEWEAQAPSSFFSFCQYELTAETLNRLAGFAGISRDPDWISEVLTVGRVRPSKYDHSPEDRHFYAEEVRRIFDDDEMTRRRLLALV
jgi:hypothetical protein